MFLRRKIFRFILVYMIMIALVSMIRADDKTKEGLKKQLEFHMSDNSIFKGEIDEKFITIKTKYGKLQIPVEDIISIDVAKIREHEFIQLEKKVVGLIKMLSDDRHKTRQDASRELTQIGSFAIPYLEKALQSKVLEIKTRAQKILDEIKTGSTEHKIKKDVIRAKEVNIKGWIEVANFKIKTKFGELDVSIKDIRHICAISSHLKGDFKIIKLPAGSISPAGKRGDKTKLLKSATPQIIRVKPGSKFSFKITYQVYAPGNPSEIDQTFFVASWTPQWPPPAGYYYPVYNGIPGLPPGVNSQATVTFQAPKKPGIYCLWWCSSAHYSMGQGVNTYNKPLKTPGHIKVIVEEK